MNPEGTEQPRRELILLTPYAYPSYSEMTLADDDMAAWMNAYTALWHPAALWGAAAPPRVDLPYDYEEPKAHHVYALPETPPSIFPHDWAEKVHASGATLILAATDRAETLARAREALAKMAPSLSPEWEPAADQPAEEPRGEGQQPPVPEQPSPEQVRERLLALEPHRLQSFFAIGLGYLLLASLSEGMEHENLLETEEFWRDVQKALAELAGVPVPATGPAAEGQRPESHVTESDYPPYEPPNYSNSSEPIYADNDNPAYRDRSEYENYGYPNRQPGGPTGPRQQAGGVDPERLEPWERHLHSAAGRLLSAREVLYPVTIYLLDVHTPDRLDSLPLDGDTPANLIAPAAALEQLHRNQPELFARLRDRVEKQLLEVCSGCYVEREDNLLPVESQLWNLRKGLETADKLLGRPVEVFARKKFGFHPQLPLFLSSCGVHRALMIPLDDSALPTYRSTVVGRSSPDGKQVDGFVRAPFPADRPETGFNLAARLLKTIREDHSATLAFLHTGRRAVPWFEDFRALSRFGTVFGEWMTFTRYFNEVMPNEYADAHSADEFHFDYLQPRVPDKDEGPPTDFPVSGFARHHRLRRQIDTCWSLAAMLRGLAGRGDALDVRDALAAVEDELELAGPDFTRPTEEAERKLHDTERQVLQATADRLLSRATGTDPGYLIVNPCSFARRLALELDRGEHPLPVADPVKACQLDDDKLRLVVEVPGLGFAWIPRSGPAGTPPPPMRLRLADDRHVRNEFFEAEIDKQTGGLAGVVSLGKQKSMVSRLAQKLVWNPGATTRATTVKATSIGPALGEVVSEGEIVGEQGQILARFRQIFRAWLGRPVLDVRIEITPEQPPAGYPWHAYFGSRFAWPDDRAMLLRGVGGTGYVTTHTRPQTPDFLEIRGHRQNTVVFPCGLPFLTKHDSRVVDLILVTPGESARVFDLAIGLERWHPMQTALGLASPVPIIETAKGPPHVGSTGWLYHLDTPNLLLTGMRPGGPDSADAVTVRLLEADAQSGHAEFRCVRNPVRAALLNARGERILESIVSGDSVFLEVTPNDFNQVHIEFE